MYIRGAVWLYCPSQEKESFARSGMTGAQGLPIDRPTLPSSLVGGGIMSKALRGILIAAGCVAFLALILAGAWLVLTRMSFPRIRGTEKLEGLSGPVTVQRDRYGVPHIYAQTSADLFFAQGFVHAQDRFWQMEFSRRVGLGRLSELFGASQLQTDIFLRTLGIARVAKAEYEQADPEEKSALEAYSAGVNAYILHRSPARLGLEFAVLNLTGVKTTIEPWTPVNSLAWAKMMAWNLGDNWQGEILVTQVLHTIGTRGFPGLFTPYRPEMPFTVGDNELGASLGGLPGPLAVFGSERGIGSNGWVIAGSRSRSGKPILANDMHLDIGMPSIWYEIGLHGVSADGRPGRTNDCPYDVLGYSLPGAPGVVSGHNDRIAWGITALGGDVQDLYLERMNPSNPDQYMVNGRWKDLDFVYEDIPVRKESEPYRLRVRMTRHGPIISDHGAQTSLEGFLAGPGGVFPANVELTSVSMRWTALQPSSVIKAELLLDRAETYPQFREALRQWRSPSLNFVYADVDGNIAYQCVGQIPIREKGSGEAPVPGWTSGFEWTGYIPFDELPRALNPAKGYLVNANNPPAGGAYRHLLGKEMDYGYRARRIVQMIESFSGPMGLQDFQAMQADEMNLTALEVCSALKGLDLGPTVLERRITEEKEKGLSEKERQERRVREKDALVRMGKARDALLSWDGRMSAESGPAALYAQVWVHLVAEIFRDQYPEAAWPMGASSRAENAVHYLLGDPQNHFWDDVTTPERETRDEILVRAFHKGYAKLVEKSGKDSTRWRWDRIHTVTFINPTLGKSGISPIEKIFNRGPYPLGGGMTQVNAEGWDARKPFGVTHGPSMRLIVDMGSLGSALSVHAPGQSGHPGHHHYGDFIEPWLKVRYHPALWDRRDVEKESEGKLVLLPR